MWPFGNTVAHGFPTDMASSWGPTPTKDPSGNRGILDLDSDKIGRRKWSYHGLQLRFLCHGGALPLEEVTEPIETVADCSHPSPVAKSCNFTTVRSVMTWRLESQLNEGPSTRRDNFAPSLA